MGIRMENLTIDDYTKNIKLEPNNYNFYIGRGILYEHKGYLDQAREDYTKAIQINPHAFEAYNNRGGIYRQEKVYDLAVSDYTKCISITRWQFKAILIVEASMMICMSI